MKGIPFLLFLLVLMFSCKKDDFNLPITYPSVYHKSGVKSTGDFRVFFSNGEIRDNSIINRFKEKDTSGYSFIAEEISRNRYTMDSIRFSDAQHAIVKDNYFSRNALITREGDKLVLTRTDTSTGYSANDELTHSWFYHMGQVKPEVFTEYLISSTRGNYEFGYTAREKFVLKESGGRLVAPLILFTQHRDQPYNREFRNNILQNDFYKWIPIGDTMTIKEYLILYEK